MSLVNEQDADRLLKIIRPFHLIGIEALSSGDFDSFTFTSPAGENTVVKRSEVVAFCALCIEANPLLREAQLKMAGKFEPQRLPKEPERGIISRWLHSSFGWLFYYGLGFIAGLVAFR